MQETAKKTTVDKNFAARILNSRIKIKSPGEIKSVMVTSVTPYDGKHIVNFKCMSIDQVKKAQKHFAAGEYQDAVNTNLSTSVLEGQFLPQKGQYVDLTIGLVPNRDKTGEVLRVIGMSPISAAETLNISFELDSEPSLDD
jgi:hypothetical protein